MPKQRTAMVARLCEQCGVGFETWRSEAARGGGRYCSPECGHAATRIPVADRFWRYIVRGPECWGWTGATTPAGYGFLGRGGRPSTPVFAHRLSWELHCGAIPDGLFVCHRCDNPPCCNPAHLFLGSAAENNADKLAKGRQPRGEVQSRRKQVTAVQVSEIRRRWAAGSVMQKQLCAEYGISAPTMSEIISRKLWAHVQ